MIEECGKRMHGTLPIRDDIITTAVEFVNMEATSSSDAIIHSTIELAQMTSSVRELSTLFRKMVEPIKPARVKNKVKMECKVCLSLRSENVGRNIRTLMRDGYPHKQAVAIALSHQRKCLGQPPYRGNKRIRKNSVKRGFKKCVLETLMHTRVRKTMCLRKCLTEAIRKCR